MRKLKRPDGALIEESTASTGHFFEDGKLTGHDSDFGDYTGRFCWCYPDYTYTRWYTTKTAPKWLLALYLEATTPREKED